MAKYPTAYQFPVKVLITIVLICVTPSILLSFGVNLSSASELILLEDTGALVHTMLEWTSIIIAFITVILGIAHFSIKRELVIPIITLALFSSVIIDIFHILAADHLITSSIKNKELIPFTWALSITFHRLILIGGTLILLFVPGLKKHHKNPVSKIIWASICFGLIALMTILVSTNSPWIPKTIYPEAFIKRPFDLIPLLLGPLSYPLFDKLFEKHPSYFSYSLKVSIIPFFLTELHMSFGSDQLYDAHFNIGHFLKIVTYSIPFFGLLIDYIKTFENLKLITDQVEKQNEELQQVSYVISHDLKAPLRGISSLTTFIEQDLGENIDEDVKNNLALIKNRTVRMENLIKGVLEYSKAGFLPSLSSSFGVLSIIDEVKGNIEFPERIKMVKPAEDLVLQTNKTCLYQVFQNLISNAIKYHDKETGTIKVSWVKDKAHYQFNVEDDGPGIDPAYHKKIFSMFETLERKDTYESTGVGLAIVKKLIEKNGGDIWVASDVGKGSVFSFTWKAA